MRTSECRRMNRDEETTLGTASGIDAEGLGLVGGSQTVLEAF